MPVAFRHLPARALPLMLLSRPVRRLRRGDRVRELGALRVVEVGAALDHDIDGLVEHPRHAYIVLRHNVRSGPDQIVARPGGTPPLPALRVFLHGPFSPAPEKMPPGRRGEKQARPGAAAGPGAAALSAPADRRSHW